MKYSKDRSKNMVILLDVKKNNSIIYKVDIQQNMSRLLSTSSASLPACLLACLPIFTIQII
jgi:hypothetical protein